MDKMTTTKPLTLEEFANRAQCHFTTASRLKSGERLPGRELLGRIRKAFDLDNEEVFDAYLSGRETFGAYLRENVFNVEIDTENDDA